MPKNATIPQRINWHLQHQRRCACRPIPELVKKAIISLGRETELKEKQIVDNQPK